MIELLQFSLERINSLQKYYQEELVIINRRVKKGKKENRLGYLLDYYFTVLASNDEEEANKESFKKLKTLIEEYVVILKPIEDGLVFFQFKDTEFLKKSRQNTDIKEASLLFRQLSDTSIIHAHNTLIMLLIRYEEFISYMLKEIYTMFPKKYLDGQSITYSEIQNMDLSEIKMAILEKEVENKMRESFTSWFDILKDHKINLDIINPQIEQLKEIYARRNIVVHNRGTVNGTYLKNSGSMAYKSGQRIDVSEEYLIAAFDCIKIILYAITVSSLKFYKYNQQQYLEAVFRLAFEELEAKSYYTSKVVFSMLMNHPTLSNEYKNMSRVNYFIAASETGENIMDALGKFDVSALENRFKIAKLVLQKRYDEAIVLLEEEISFGNITPDIFDWPLYAHFVKTSAFTKFKNNHKDIFEKSVLDVKDVKPEDVKIPGSSIRENIEESKKDSKQ